MSFALRVGPLAAVPREQVNYKDRNQISGCQGLRLGVRRLTVKGHLETFGGDGNVPHLLLVVIV